MSASGGAIRVLVADDHAIVREGLRALFDTDPDVEIVGEASDGEQAIERALALRPDVLLLDLVLPRKDAFEVIEAVKQAEPELPILVLTSFADSHKVLRALKLGADGYMLKDSSPKELLDAVRMVAQGQTALAAAISRTLVQELHKDAQTVATESLTDREHEVLVLIAQGLSNQQIADRLVISERTTRTHVGNILGKLGLENRTQAALYAVRHGFVAP